MQMIMLPLLLKLIMMLPSLMCIILIHTQTLFHFTMMMRMMYQVSLNILQCLYTNNTLQRFSLPHGVDPTAQLLCHLAFLDSLIDSIVKYTNMYAKVRHDKLKKIFKPVTNDKILASLAMYYYMGLVKYCTKADYWEKDVN